MDVLFAFFNGEKAIQCIEFEEVMLRSSEERNKRSVTPSLALPKWEGMEKSNSLIICLA